MAAPRIVGLDHVVLRVSDLERARKFYCDVLGASVEVPPRRCARSLHSPRDRCSP